MAFVPCALRLGHEKIFTIAGEIGANQRQSRADSERRFVGRQFQTGRARGDRGRLERSNAGKNPEAERKTRVGPAFHSFCTSVEIAQGFLFSSDDDCNSTWT